MTTKPVPHEVIPCDRLPAGQYRDLPEPPHWRKLVGPSIPAVGAFAGQWGVRALALHNVQVRLRGVLGLHGGGADPVFHQHGNRALDLGYWRDCGDWFLPPMVGLGWGFSGVQRGPSGCGRAGRPGRRPS